MINIDDDYILEPSVANLNNNEMQHTVGEGTEQPLSHCKLFAMAINRFYTIWRLLTGQRRLQQSFIASLDTFVERARKKQSLCIQTWIETNLPQTEYQNNIVQPVAGMLSVNSFPGMVLKFRTTFWTNFLV